MIKSSSTFLIKDKEEKEIFLDIPNRNVVLTISIKCKKYNFCCTSYCLCGVKKKIYKIRTKYYNELFFIFCSNIKTNEKFKFQIYSNVERKLVLLHKGEYMIEIRHNKKSLLKIRINIVDSYNTINFDIEV